MKRKRQGRGVWSQEYCALYPRLKPASKSHRTDASANSTGFTRDARASLKSSACAAQRRHAGTHHILMRWPLVPNADSLCLHRSCG